MPTLVVKRLVATGHEKEYERSIARLIDHAEEMDGYMGINIARPIKKDYPLYIFSAKFDTAENLDKFKQSEYRKECLRELREITQKPISERTLTGLDWWFVLPSGVTDMSRVKMFLLTLLGAYPIVLILNIIAYSNERITILAVKALIMVFITISTMTYITLPLLLKIFAKWLYPKFE